MCLIRREVILAAVQDNIIPILRKVPNMQLALIRGITWEFEELRLLGCYAVWLL
jgi:hypothetical protein